MATYNWELYNGSIWYDIDINTLVFSGDSTVHTVAINVDEFNSGTHLGSGDPGAHMCNGNCIYNVKYASDTQFFGGGSTTSETISNTTLTNTEATIRLKLSGTEEFQTSGGYFFCFDGTTETVAAPGIQAYAVEIGKGASAWTEINDYSANVGGNNPSERLMLSGQSTASFHYYYIAITVSPETYGNKTAFDFGVEITFS